MDLNAELCLLFLRAGHLIGELSKPATFEALVAYLKTDDLGYVGLLRDRLTEALEVAGIENDHAKKVADHGRLKALWLYGVNVLPPHREDLQAWLTELDAAIAERIQRERKYPR